MSEHPRSHTEKSRSKLGLTLKKVWARRLKKKKIQQKCYLEWAQLISEAAKNGWHDQPQLEWDSYEKIEAEFSRQHVFWLQIKAEEKRIAKLRAEERAKVKAEKMAMLAKQKEREEKKKKGKLKLRGKREQNRDSAKFRNLKLKARLIKIHRKKQLVGQISFQEVSRSAHNDGIALEKWDLDYIMKEKVEQQLPFEDLLRAAKNNNLSISRHS